jgi:mRNA interferase RelE/StbE
MGNYQVVLSRSARKELESFPDKVADRIIACLDALEDMLRPVGCLKLKGASQWRIRIGDYRVVYAIEDATKVVDVIFIRHRRDVYRDL